MGIDDNNAERNQAPKAEAVSSEKLMNDVMNALMMNATKEAGNEINNLGQIDKMEMPGGWQAGPDYNSAQHAATYQEYHPNGAPDCQIGFYYRGKRTSDFGGKNFHELLDKAPHELSPEELRSVKETLRDKADPNDFTLSSARTEDLNGKRVLIVEGRYNAIQQDSKHIFVDSDGSGTAVQELFFQAPKEKFPQYKKAADEAIKSIRWK